MAGLRVGYAIGNPALVNEVEKSRGPYKVGALSSTAAIAALEHDIPWIEQVVDQTLTVRSRFVDCIQSLGYRPLPSDANFLLIPTENATSVANRMLEAGIGIRSFRNLPGIGDALRITMAPWPMMEQVLTVLEAQAQ